MSENPCNSPLTRQSKPRFAENSPVKPTWTTRRCNHLLRSLSSRLNDLRKAQKESIPATEEAGTRLNPRHSITSDTILSTNGKCQDWASSPIPPKKIRRTYSAREAGNGVQRRLVLFEAGAPENEPSLRIPSSSSGTYSQSLLGEFVKNIDLDCGTSDKQSSISTTTTTTAAATSRRDIYSNKQAPAQDLLPYCLKVNDPKRGKLIHGIFMALIALLRATSGYEIITPIGSRSLFSTCLRRTSDYIAAEELRLKEEDPKNTDDISTNVYDDLEAIGSSIAGGWAPLGEVVRAHGISMLGTAVKDGLLDTVVARGLARICLHHGAVDEGQQIMECMISTLKAVDKPANVRGSLLASSSLGTLDNFACISRRYGFQYRELTKLFREGILPIEWMATNDMIPCWNRLMLSLTEGKENTQDAEEFLRTALLMSFRVPYKSLPSRMHNIRLRAWNIQCTSSGFPSTLYKAIQIAKQQQLSDEDEVEDMDHALRTTSLRLLAILSAINCQNSGSTVDSATAKLRILQDIILEVHQAFRIWQNEHGSGGASSFHPDTDLICLPLLAAGLVSGRIGKDRVNIHGRIRHYFDILKYWKPSSEFSNVAATFLCLVINYCVQVSSIDAFQYLQEFVMCLTQPNFPNDIPETQSLFRRIATTAAIQWAKGTNIPKHLTWALDLESSINRMTMGADLQTPSRSSVIQRLLTKTKCDFRWEEGICEWVAGTPVISAPKLDLVLEKTKSGCKRDEGVCESVAKSLLISVTKPAIHKQQEKINVIWNETKSRLRQSKGVCERVEGIPLVSMAKPDCIAHDKVDATLTNVFEKASAMSVISRAKPIILKQQDKTNAFSNSATIVTVPSAKPAPCLVEVSSNSLKFNGVSQIAEPPFLSSKKSACARFFRVEVDHSQRKNCKKVHELVKTSSNTTETHPVRIAPPQPSKADTVAPPKNTSGRIAPMLDHHNSHLEPRNTRTRSQKPNPCKRKASPSLCTQQQQQAESARTKRPKQLPEQVESEDELCLS